MSDELVRNLPWDSEAIPEWTRAPDGALTPSGRRAVFRSSSHAWFALRLVYLADVSRRSPGIVKGTEQRYRCAWDRFARHCDEMRAIAALLESDTIAAADAWNAIDQCEVDLAFSRVICEREPSPTTNLATLACSRFGLAQSEVVGRSDRDRKLTKRDNALAWEASQGGTCQSCGVPTLSQRQYENLRKELATRGDLFDLSPKYRRVTGSAAPLWSERILIAAKGVADHIVPWSVGGRTNPGNLANVCAGCNYSRRDLSLDVLRVAAFRTSSSMESVVSVV